MVDRLLLRLLDRVERDTEAAQRARTRGQQVPQTLIAHAGRVLRLGQLGDRLVMISGGETAYHIGQEAVRHGRFFAAASYFADAERAFGRQRRGRSGQDRRQDAASGMLAWSLARTGRLDEAIAILERLAAALNDLAGLDDADPLWPRQTVGARKQWLADNLRWARDEKRREQGDLPPASLPLADLAGPG